MRRSDSALDYVPTHYITDIVKSIVHDDVAEYAGIEHKSVMHNGGYPKCNSEIVARLLNNIVHNYLRLRRRKYGKTRSIRHHI